MYGKSEDKCILYKGNYNGALLNEEEHQNCNPGIWLLKNKNTLRVNIGWRNFLPRRCATTKASECVNVSQVESCDINNFPLQKWVNLNVSLRSNVSDIYMDGDLVKSCILSGSPLSTKGDMRVCQDGGFNGYLSNLKYSNKPLSSNTISSIYRGGPTVKKSWFNF